MNKRAINIIPVLIAILILVLPGCDTTAKLKKEEAAEIQNYLDNHPDLNYELKESGLYYLDEVVGTGLQAETHDTAFVFFTGYTIDGSKFTTNEGTTDTLIRPVNEGWLIKGFDEALTYMKEGGKAKVLIPSSLAYYDYYPLLFDIRLVRVVKGPGPGRK